MPIILETTQNRARPLGNCKVKKANISGIIHSIILFIDCCFGSVVLTVAIFC